MIHDISDTTASVFFVPDFFVFEMPQARWTEIDGMPLVSVFDTPFLGVDGWHKRTEDVLVAAAALTVTAPLMLAIAIGVKLSSPGPVLFRQRRFNGAAKWWGCGSSAPWVCRRMVTISRRHGAATRT